MNKLEDRIREKREELDGFEPREGHTHRFADKLDMRHRGIFTRARSIKIAALLLLLLASSVFVYRYGYQLPSRKNIPEQELKSSELLQAESYFASQITEVYNAIDRFAPSDPEQKRMLMTEIDQMDSMLVSLQEELQANPNDDRIIHAMINHYQLKLEVMGQILTQLKKIQQTTNNRYESTDI